MPTSEDVVTYVAANPQAIGYVSRGHLAPLLASFDLAGTETPPSSLPISGTLASIRVVAVEGVLPVSGALREQRYPLTQPLYLISQGPPTGWMRQFLDFVLSPAGQTIVGRFHVPIR
jgi:phosphate transport system substrate-binding protein